MTATIPIFRIFDLEKAKEFYLDWLGFKVDWEHQPDSEPIYFQISLDNIFIHLSEHHGDATPGSAIRIDNFENISGYHAELIAKKYKYNRPGLEKAFYDETELLMEVIDPFGNRIIFSGKN